MAVHSRAWCTRAGRSLAHSAGICLFWPTGCRKWRDTKISHATESPIAGVAGTSLALLRRSWSHGSAGKQQQQAKTATYLVAFWRVVVSEGFYMTKKESLFARPPADDTADAMRCRLTWLGWLSLPSSEPISCVALRPVQRRRPALHPFISTLPTDGDHCYCWEAATLVPGSRAQHKRGRNSRCARTIETSSASTRGTLGRTPVAFPRPSTNIGHCSIGEDLPRVAPHPALRRC